MDTICYLDMDGPIVDLVGGVCRRFGLDNPYDRGEEDYDFATVLGMGSTELWSSIDYETWATLPVTKDARAIVALVERSFDDVVILTTPTDYEFCRDGKKAWVRSHFPQFSDKLIFESEKWKYAGAYSYLIDDKEENCDEFVREGGKAFLYPRPWNRRREIEWTGVSALVDWIYAETHDVNREDSNL